VKIQTEAENLLQLLRSDLGSQPRPGLGEKGQVAKTTWASPPGADASGASPQGEGGLGAAARARLGVETLMALRVVDLGHLAPYLSQLELLLVGARSAAKAASDS